MRIPSPSRLDYGIFLISFAILFVELMLTRIFSVTLYYHLSFMAVSIAMLGLGLSGLIVNLWPSKFPESSFSSQLARGARRFAVSTVVVMGAAFYLSVPVESSPANWARLAAIYVMCAIPFLAGGLVIALILTHHSERAHRLYFFDLIGAALGCVVFIPATNWLGAPTAILAGAAVAALAAFFFAVDFKSRRNALILCGALIIAAVVNSEWNFYDVRVAKGRRQASTLAVSWNSFSRVEVQGTTQDLVTPRQPQSDGFSAKLGSEFRVPEVYLRYDADALTQITGFDGDLARLWHLPYDIASAPYHLRRYRNVLIIGPGGGRDVLTALHMGSGPVTGVEVNPLTVDLMRGQFREFTGSLYEGYPGVHIVNDEARSFLQHSPAQYDLIQASLIDTWAASAVGAHALTENSLYTVEAFSDYLNHLTPDGVVSFSRWYLDPPVESLRVVTLAIEALRRQKIDNAAQHVVVVRTNSVETHRPSMCTVLIKRSPFSTEEVAALRAWAKKMGFLVTFSPDDSAIGSPPNHFHMLLGPRHQEFVSNFPYDISAVYDDRPFFFNRVPVLAWIGNQTGLVKSRSGEGALTVGGQTLLVLLIVTGLSTLVILSLPVWAGRRDGKAAGEPTLRRVKGSRRAVWALYFACLGVGFIMVEIVLIQRFSLFLGYPVYSISVVLFTLLLASGVGSLLASLRPGPQILPWVLGLVCITLGTYSLGLPWLLDRALWAPTAVRIALAGGLVAPLGVMMGVPFPTGLRWAGRDSGALVPWAWAINGGTSVFSSTLAILISMTYGFTTTFLLGAVAYLIALSSSLWLNRDSEGHGGE